MYPILFSLTVMPTMKIKDHHFNIEDTSKVKIELLDLLRQPSDKDERPCPGCRLTFPGVDSTTSTANCSMNCPAAPLQMSSDPDRFPIEKHVVPVVYSIYSLKLMMPCWSCEGHLDKSQNITKMPKIWFYSVSPFYAKLVSQVLSDLRQKRDLENDWIVRILPFSQSMFTLTYCIEPVKDLFTDYYELTSLQNDMLTIGEKLRSEVLRLADKYVVKANKSPFKEKNS